MKKDFPLLSQSNVHYLDSASSSQTPDAVIAVMNEYYRNLRSNVGRGFYSLSHKATEEYEKARARIAEFINANPEEIVFTKGTTESINLLANTLSKEIEKNILLTELEHHSNMLPWRKIAGENDLKIESVRLKPNLELDFEDLKNKLKEAGVFAFTSSSNAIGVKNDVKKISDLCSLHDVLSVVDAAQSVGHEKIDVKKIGCDFLVFSGHKMLGPTGIGVLYGKKALLEKLSPAFLGGGVVEEVYPTGHKLLETPGKFEAGTPNISGALGLASAVEYIENIGLENVNQKSAELAGLARKKLSEIPGVKIYGNSEESHIVSFNLQGIHCHDVASLLDDFNVFVRSGHHCCMPLMEKLGISGSVRASFYFYNTEEDVSSLVQGIKRIKEVFK